MARERAFAAGKRDDLYSPATSLQVPRRVLPAIYTLLTSKEEIVAKYGER